MGRPGRPTSIQQKAIFRQDNEPGRKEPGVLWIDTSGNNVEWNTWNGDAGVWELLHARGPDTPTYPVEGSLWRDTGNGEFNEYDGTAWDKLGGVPSGTVVMLNDTISNVPSGWLACDGANGTMDFGAKYPSGAVDDGDLGTFHGTNSVTLTESQMPSHTHGVQGQGQGGSTSGLALGDGVDTGTVTSDPTGGDSAHTNKPASRAITFMEKA